MSPYPSLPVYDRKRITKEGYKGTFVLLELITEGITLVELDRPLILGRSCGSLQTDMEKVRAHVIIEGRVQGVFFRHHTQEAAFKLGVKGWVKNRRDGCVEAVFEGDQERVDQLIQWCHRGPSEARVTKVHSTLENYTGQFEDFSVTY